MGRNFPPTNSQAQSVKSELTQIREAYESLQGMSADIQFELFDSFEAIKPIDVQSGKFRQAGNKSYSQFGSSEVLTNDKYSLVIDHEEKLMLIQNPLPVSFSPETQIPMDSLLAICSKVTWKDIDPSKRSITFLFENYEFQKVQIFYDSKSHILNKVILFQANPSDLLGNQNPILGRMEITYVNTLINPSFTSKDFSERIYVQKEKGKIVPASSYSNYQLANYLPRK